MRKLTILTLLGPVLALSACGENAGWNPNYSAMHNGSSYATYMRSREAALQVAAPIPRTVPVQLPVNSPRPEDIASPRAIEAHAAAVARTHPGVVMTTAPGPAVAPVDGPPGTPALAAPGTVQPVAAQPAPDLARYARRERRIPGTTVYKRTGGSVQSAASTCSGYASAEAAQRAFIRTGGPVIDPRGMDPDGDGYVCGWTPGAAGQTSP